MPCAFHPDEDRANGTIAEPSYFDPYYLSVEDVIAAQGAPTKQTLMGRAERPSRRGPHGQAPLAAYRAEAVIDRQIDELIGLAKGVVADGQVSQSEAEFLLRWLETNRAARSVWPASVLFPRLVAALADG